MSSPLEQRRARDFSHVLRELGWYHTMELPDGTIIEGWNKLDELKRRYAEFPLPADLSGKRALDVGAWDGFFTFELEKHGAAVTAIDVVQMETFLTARRLMGSKARYLVGDVYELPQMGLGKFDVVLFLGVLYHLRHPLLALEKICAMTTDLAIVDSFVAQAPERNDVTTTLPWLEFYELDELGNQYDNWFGPTREALAAMCRAAGFARVEFLSERNSHAKFACYRQWLPEPAQPTADAPVLGGVCHARDYGINFQQGKEQYISCWFRCDQPDLKREDLMIDVGGYGAPAIYLRSEGPGGWMANVVMPPGVDSGWLDVRLRLANSRFSNTLKVAMDVPLETYGLELYEVRDAASQEASRVNAGGTIEVTLYGLAANADRNNTPVFLGGHKLEPKLDARYDSSERTLKAAVPASVTPGNYSLLVQHGGRHVTAAVTVVA